ncbi:MAG: murein biosynthesis integral membrane protein MurJ [Thermoleophilaceae bacterium]
MASETDPGAGGAGSEGSPASRPAASQRPSVPQAPELAQQGGRVPLPGDAPEPSQGQRLARSTAFFSFATGLSRIAGLIREIVVASIFGVSGAMSAFTIAFQVPNLVRALFADMALQGAFVPVFTELLEKGERKEAFRIASTLFFVILLALGGLTALFMLLAPVIVPLFTPGFSPELDELTVSLSRLMFPIVVMLALTGLVVGMLNSFGHFSVPALAPAAWNVVIIAAIVGLMPVFPEEDEIYTYAVGILAGTLVQFLLPTPWLRGRGGRFTLSLDWRNPLVLRVIKLMFPVTIALGLINFSGLINSSIGTLVNDSAPAAIDKAFRIYMLPQGLFSIAIATILFPTLSRFAARGEMDEMRRTMGNGVRLIALFLIPSAMLMAVLAEPITRLIFERGVFDARATDLVTDALIWWSLSLPFQGISLLLSRTYFSLQRPWVTTGLAGANLIVNAAVSLALYKPLGISGIVIGTVVGTIGMALAQFYMLRPDLHGVEGGRTLVAGVRMVLAAVLLGGVSYGVWWLLDDALGRALVAQAVSLGAGILAGSLVYAAIVWALRMPEGRQVATLLPARFRGGGGA